MDILEFLLSVADDLTDKEFDDCTNYLDLQVEFDEPDWFEHMQYLEQNQEHPRE